MAGKNEALDLLGRALDSYWMGIAALAFFNDEQTPALLQDLTYRITPTSEKEVEFSKLATALRIGPWRDIATMEFGKMCLRAFLTEMFEIVKAYGERTSQMSKLWKQSWYHFARLIRNSVSHHGVFMLKGEDEGLFPVEWHGKAITKEMHGTYASIDLCNFDDVFAMYDEVRAFVENELR